jgi:hypothetical protein
LMSNISFAQDRPSYGLIYNATEWSSLQYECAPQADGSLNCNMEQASVRRESGSKTLKDEIAKALVQLKTEKPLKPEQCAEFEQMVSVIKNPAPAAQGSLGIQAMDPRAKDDLLKSMSAAAEFCRNPTEQTLTRLTTLGFEKETRTCMVHANNFSLQFKRVAGSQTWASNNGPAGLCGVVTVARLEPDPKYPTFYNYIQKRVVTNPSESMFSNMKCSDLDQGETKYLWQSREIYARCDYIKFGF